MSHAERRPSAMTIGRAGLAIFVGVAAVEHAAVPALSPSRHTLSEYVNAPGGPPMVVGFLAWSVSLCATAVASRGDPFLAAPLALSALGVGITACFPTQTSGGVLIAGDRRTLSGQLHDAGSSTVTITLLGAALASVVDVRRSATFRRMTGSLLALAIAVVAMPLVVGSRAPGVRQRVLVGAACVWQVLLLRSASPSAPRGRRCCQRSEPERSVDRGADHGDPRGS